MKYSLLALALCTGFQPLHAQTAEVPDWAQPGTATHQQVPPPTDFHRPSKNFAEPIGEFLGQSDVGGPLLPGSASYDASTKRYTINSASYNIWYTRDEMRFLWKQLSGDVSLAADISFPNPDGYSDRKVVLIIRQDLDDDSKEVMAGLHGAGLIHLAQRSVKSANIAEVARIEGRGDAAGASAGDVATKVATRLGIEKHGDSFALFVSLNGEPMHQVGAATKLKFDEPFYVGIGFCSHLPDKSDSAVVSRVVLENTAGKVR